MQSRRFLKHILSCRTGRTRQAASTSASPESSVFCNAGLLIQASRRSPPGRDARDTALAPRAPARWRVAGGARSGPPPPCAHHGLGLSRTPSTASHTSSGVSPGRTSEAARLRGALPGLRARNSARQLPRAPAAVQPPQLPYLHLPVALGLARVGARDFDLDHQIGRGVLDEGFGAASPPFGQGREIASGALADVERAVWLHPCAGRLASPAKSGTAEPLRRTGEGTPRGVHDVIEDLGQVLVEVRGVPSGR